MQTKVFGLGLGLGLVALAWAGVDLRPPAQAPGGVADVVYLATVASWLTLVWLLVGAAVTALGRLRGRPGRWADAVASRITPPAVRRAVHLALGAALTVGPVAGGGPAFAGGVGGRWGPGPQPTQPNLDWPAGAPAGPAAPPVAASAAPTAPAARPPARPPAGRVVVAAGDTLWSIAAAALGPSATDAQIAASWPRWYAVNRAVIGPDPDLIYPGQRLVAP